MVIHYVLPDFLKRFLTKAEMLELSPYVSDDSTVLLTKDIRLEGSTPLPVFCTANLLELKKLNKGEGIDDGCISRLVLGSLLVDYIFGDSLSRDVITQVTSNTIRVYGAFKSDRVLNLTIKTKERSKHISFEADYSTSDETKHYHTKVELDYYRISSLFTEELKTQVRQLFEKSGYRLEEIKTKYVSAQVEIREADGGYE